MVQLHEKETLEPVYLQYINRLSDFMFVAARYINAQRGIDEIPWKGTS
jgi:cob(I)alamin adenosyltransferase